MPTINLENRLFNNGKPVYVHQVTSVTGDTDGVVASLQKLINDGIFTIKSVGSAHSAHTEARYKNKIFFIDYSDKKVRPSDYAIEDVILEVYADLGLESSLVSKLRPPPLKVMISSGASYFKLTKEEVERMAAIVAEHFPISTLYLTGGVPGPAFDFVQHIARLNGLSHVSHFLPLKNWSYKDENGEDLYGLVTGAHRFKIGNSMAERLKAMSETSDVSIMLEGGLGSLEEALIVHTMGGKNIYFPSLGHAPAILNEIIRYKRVPKPPTYMSDGYEEVIKTLVPDLPVLEEQVQVPEEKCNLTLLRAMLHKL